MGDSEKVFWTCGELTKYGRSPESSFCSRLSGSGGWNGETGRGFKDPIRGNVLALNFHYIRTEDSE